MLAHEGSPWNSCGSRDMPLSTRATMSAVLPRVVAEHQMSWPCWSGRVCTFLSRTSVLQQNIRESILITKYVSLRLPPSFPKREVFYVGWKSTANCAMWLLFLGEDLVKKLLKSLIVIEQLKIIEELKILFRQPEVAIELLEKLPFLALVSGSCCIPLADPGRWTLGSLLRQLRVPGKVIWTTGLVGSEKQSPGCS